MADLQVTVFEAAGDTAHGEVLQEELVSIGVASVQSRM